MSKGVKNETKNHIWFFAAVYIGFGKLYAHEWLKANERNKEQNT